MNIEEQKKIIAEEMKTWISVDTWDTLHSDDIKRFNKGLEKCLKRINGAISEDVFEAAIIDILKESDKNNWKKNIPFCKNIYNIIWMLFHIFPIIVLTINYIRNRDFLMWFFIPFN